MNVDLVTVSTILIGFLTEWNVFSKSFILFINVGEQLGMFFYKNAIFFWPSTLNFHAVLSEMQTD